MSTSTELNQACAAKHLNQVLVCAFLDSVIGDQPWIDLLDNIPAKLIKEATYFTTLTSVPSPVTVTAPTDTATDTTTTSDTTADATATTATDTAATTDNLVDDLTPAATESTGTEQVGTSLGGITPVQQEFIDMCKLMAEYFVIESDFTIDGDQILVTLDTYKTYCVLVNDKFSKEVRGVIKTIEELYCDMCDSDSSDSDSSNSDHSTDYTHSESSRQFSSSSDDEADYEDIEGDDSSSSSSDDDGLGMAVYGCNKSKTDAACYTLMNIFRSVKTVNESKATHEVKDIFIKKFLSFVDSVSISTEY
jgi:hypothetical protein